MYIHTYIHIEREREHAGADLNPDLYPIYIHIYRESARSPTHSRGWSATIRRFVSRW